MGFYRNLEFDYSVQAVEDSTANITINIRSGTNNGRFNPGSALNAFANAFLANFTASSGYSAVLLSASQGYSEAYITLQISGLSDSLASYYYTNLPHYSNTPGYSYVT